MKKHSDSNPSLRSVSKENEIKKKTAKLNSYGINVDYHPIKLSDLVIEQVGDKDFSVSTSSKSLEKSKAGQRFFQSLSRKTGINKDFFKIFSPAEVLDRVVEIEGDQELVLASDSFGALAVSRPQETLIHLNDALSVIESHSPTDVDYYDGEIRARFKPSKSGGDTEVTREVYSKLFQLNIPVDGFDLPSLSPIMIRQVCTNGLLAESALFTSQIKIGREDAGFTIDRALKAYNGDQHYSRIAELLTVSKSSWSSIAEVAHFEKLLLKSKIDFRICSKMLNIIWEMAGKSAALYHREHQGKNPKMSRKIQTNLNRYDLINMITEASSHLVESVESKRALEGYVGDLLSRDPDLEHSADDKLSRPSPDFFFKKLA